jgi:uncharacterized protein YyaL (SSP411 family)
MFKSLLGLIFLPLLANAHLAADLQQTYADKGEHYQARTQHLNSQGRALFVNHLILSASPYLLQHAHNPVNWFEFSPEAFTQAQRENKPIFISIGYATCHWCHIMEVESFDEIDAAKILNQHFIAIKVDRELRPDVDATYMAVAQLLNGSGGWPLNVIVLPDGRAFFAGTYFPKQQLLQILNKTSNLWRTDKTQIIRQASDIETRLNPVNPRSDEIIKPNLASILNQILTDEFDEFGGGFGQAPKFPNESILLFLLDAQRKNPTPQRLEIIHTTLEMMASGGLYDVVGGGFHRYAVDNAWIVPHFEKMLYNQARLALVYTRAYRLTRRALYRRIAQQTLDYVLGQMQGKNGGFFSATDADSAGKEGSFFVWSVDEIKNNLSENDFKKFNRWFDLSANTEFEGDFIIRFKDLKTLKIEH